MVVGRLSICMLEHYFYFDCKMMLLLHVNLPRLPPWRRRDGGTRRPCCRGRGQIGPRSSGRWRSQPHTSRKCAAPPRAPRCSYRRLSAMRSRSVLIYITDARKDHVFPLDLTHTCTRKLIPCNGVVTKKIKSEILDCFKNTFLVVTQFT